jgi:hypothetical protein
MPVIARLVIEWGKQYREDLLRIWNEQIFMQLPGLE